MTLRAAFWSRTLAIVGVAALSCAPDMTLANVAAGLPGTGLRAGPPVQRKAIGAPRQVMTWHRVPPGAHTFYGTIVAMNGTLLTIRLRTRRFQAVDATTAIDGGNFSAPLFIGKLVCIDGSVNGSTLTAAHVFRVTNFLGLGPDK